MKGATTQVDVWRKLWEVDPEWEFFLEIDLKDGFFSIPVDELLSKQFAFCYDTKRYRWTRLPQGWSWSSVLFHERVAEILRGVRCLQYADNVLVGARTPEELLEVTRQVFERFREFGIKVNFRKIKWLSRSIKFLGHEICGGRWNQEGYIKDKMAQVGEVKTMRDLERVIGVISYARRAIVDAEAIFGPTTRSSEGMEGSEGVVCLDAGLERKSHCRISCGIGQHALAYLAGREGGILCLHHRIRLEHGARCLRALCEVRRRGAPDRPWESIQ